MEDKIGITAMKNKSVKTVKTLSNTVQKKTNTIQSNGRQHVTPGNGPRPTL